MLVCLLATLASGSFARFHCDVCSFFFPTSSRNSFATLLVLFHVDNNRATAHASHERRLSASRDIRSIRIAITVPCQQHQQESLVMPLSCNCRTVSLRCYHTFLCGASASTPIQASQFVMTLSRNCKNCLVTMALYFFAVPAPALLFWVIYAVYHIAIYSYRK